MAVLKNETMLTVMNSMKVSLSGHATLPQGVDNYTSNHINQTNSH